MSMLITATLAVLASGAAAANPSLGRSLRTTNLWERASGDITDVTGITGGDTGKKIAGFKGYEPTPVPEFKTPTSMSCGGDGEPACARGCNLLKGMKMIEDDAGVCHVVCGGTGEPPCDDTGCKKGSAAEAAGGLCVDGCGDPFWVCCDGPKRCKRDTLTCIAKEGKDLRGVPFTEACVNCGGLDEPICEEPGATECEKGLENQGGVCKEPCGDIGELPCDDGCKVGMAAAAAGGVCVRGCGDPKWVCCDADKDGGRCKRSGFTCVAQTGTDRDGIDFKEACTPCGGLDEPICEEPEDKECEAHLENVGGFCKEPCGGTGELPCKDTGCDKGMAAEAAGGVCVDGCGDPFWVCCDGPKRCKRSGLTCVDQAGKDLRGIPFTQACVNCGGLDEPICEEPGDDECEKGLENQGGVCVEPCGKIGQLPCPKTGCESNMSAEAAGGLCVQSCGDPYWVCCDADKDGGRCKSSGLTCVDMEGTDKNGVDFWQACTRCGAKDQPMCEEPGATPCNKGLWADKKGICRAD